MTEGKIINLNTEEEVRDVAQEVLEEIKQQEQEDENLFQQLVDELSNINPELGGFEEFATILSLPDEQFEVVAPIFLDEISKSYNIVDNQIRFAQILNANGIYLEDLKTDFDNITSAIDQMPEESFSQAKKDFLKSLIALTTNSVMSTVGIAKRVMEVPFTIDEQGGKEPAYAHITDAGADICANEDIDIPAGEHVLIHTGIHVSVPNGYEIQVRAKSGISLKTNLIIKNGIGTIDENYTGEICVIMANIAPPIKNLEIDEDGKIKSIEYGAVEHIDKGQKIAQLVLSECPKMAFFQVQSLNEPVGERGAAGFGSTGI